MFVNQYDSYILYLGCQSHTDLRMIASTFGHMQEGSRRGFSISVTVLVRVFQELVHHHLFAKIFTVKRPCCTHLQNSSGNGIYTTNTLWDGKDCNPGSHCCNNALAPWFRRTLEETTTEDIEVRWCVRCCATESALNSWSSTFTNPSNAASIK